LLAVVVLVMVVVVLVQVGTELLLALLVEAQVRSLNFF
jgi:hypothetical protein